MPQTRQPRCRRAVSLAFDSGAASESLTPEIKRRVFERSRLTARCLKLVKCVAGARFRSLSTQASRV
ncbi:MAG: hypothetical protein DWH96_02165 [Planctomycetota bacterium]|nr:MAG: hypothetical protein DWH96_02165 [Planctomycetota bacterium]